MGAVLAGLKALGPGRLAAMAAVSAALFALLAILAVHGGGGGRMALLYADLDLHEASQIADQLDAQHVAHEVSSSGDRIMVPEAEVGRVRLLLARQGLPSGGSVGYELFDRGDGLTASDFQQRIEELRALEGELTRTIELIHGIRAARVHLVLPKREPFSREQQQAQAAVLLTLVGAQRLDREGVQAVLNLVAAAVPGLRPADISIIDSRGDVLSRAGEPTDGAGAAQGMEEVRRGIEQRLAHAVEEMLDRTLGPGHARAEASVDLDFAQTHETQESYDPNGQVVRSTQQRTDNSRSTEGAPAVTVQNNLPNADAAAKTGAGTEQQKQEETTNYEIGRTVRTIVRDQPQIRRISLAVMVDGQQAGDKWAPLPAEQMAGLTTLVRDAVGYDAKRGDAVEVVNMRFAEDAPLSASPPAHRLLGLDLDAPSMAGLGQAGVFGLIALCGLLFVLRPMMLRLTAGVPHSDLLQLAAAPAQAMLAGTVGGELLALPKPGGIAALAGQAGMAVARLAEQEDDALLEMANVSGPMRASFIRRVSDLVERHPDESLSVVRSWLAGAP